MKIRHLTDIPADTELEMKCGMTKDLAQNMRVNSRKFPKSLSKRRPWQFFICDG